MIKVPTYTEVFIHKTLLMIRMIVTRRRRSESLLQNFDRLQETGYVSCANGKALVVTVELTTEAATTRSGVANWPLSL